MATRNVHNNSPLSSFPHHFSVCLRRRRRLQFLRRKKRQISRSTHIAWRTLPPTNRKAEDFTFAAPPRMCVCACLARDSKNWDEEDREKVRKRGMGLSVFLSPPPSWIFSGPKFSLPDPSLKWALGKYFFFGWGGVSP